jgi:hypothetical protein
LALQLAFISDDDGYVFVQELSAEMTNALSRSNSFIADGYYMIPNFIEANELTLLGQAVDAVLVQPTHLGMSRPGNDLAPLRWNDEIVSLILRAPDRINRLTAAIAAPDLKWLSAYVSTKPAFTPPLCWHQDWWAWNDALSFNRPAPQVAVLIYLSETTPQNGALRLLPGSHRASCDLHASLPEPHSSSANSLAVGHPAMSDHPEQVTPCLRAGDAVVIDYRLLHGTHANKSSSRRDCVLLSFIPDWTNFPSELKEHVSAHPALPTAGETAEMSGLPFVDVLPRFAGRPVDIRINRVPPPLFAIV